MVQIWLNTCQKPWKIVGFLSFLFGVLPTINSCKALEQVQAHETVDFS